MSDEIYRFRNWCFTAYTQPVIPEEKTKYCVYQIEICPTTGKEHFQGYIEFIQKYSMKRVKELFNDNKIHLEKRMGSQAQANAYCTKKETRKPDTKPFFFGLLQGQGHRTDLDEIFEEIEEGKTTKEILQMFRGNGLRHINCIERGLIAFHDFSSIDTWIKLQRKKDKDPLDEKVNDEIEKKLLDRN